MDKKKAILIMLFIANLVLISSVWYYQNTHFRDPEHTIDGHTFIALGRILGLVGAYLILCQFLLIGRVAWIERVFGMDNLSRYHHYNGLVGFLFIVFHVFFIVLGYSLSSNTPFIEQYFVILQSHIMFVMASIAFFMLAFLILFALSMVYLKLNYELWYLTHLFVYAVVALSFFHQVIGGADFVRNNAFLGYWLVLYTFVFVNFIAFRFIKPIRQFFYQDYRVEKLVRETEDVTSVYITGKHLEKLNTRAGQFFIFRFLSRDFFWQAHPFSLSLAPNNKHLRISMKSLGDFTNAVPKKLKPGTRVFIEGPLGKFTQERSRHDEVTLIAGGIGITPLRALAEAFAKQKKNVQLIYGNQTSTNVALKHELDALAKEYENFSWTLVVSDEPHYKGEKGYIDTRLLAKHVLKPAKKDYYVCGPTPMMKSVRTCLKQLGVKRGNIHIEKFSLA
ncbi:hypothetical protein COT72_01050 [archaeon CG10_big_fil_rev_8_21_14_0_10_43_11]|nr:MAG: hypothetical protein COT72_01050 [archaeon CG10_big_fil_rev_8_21_14_0_10_43_11]